MSFYDILGVPQDADQATIKAAYRKLALIHHPDAKHPQGNPEMFPIISSAFAVLSDPVQRSKYDDKLQKGDSDGESMDATSYSGDQELVNLRVIILKPEEDNPYALLLAGNAVLSALPKLLAHALIKCGVPCRVQGNPDAKFRSFRNELLYLLLFLLSAWQVRRTRRKWLEPPTVAVVESVEQAQNRRAQNRRLVGRSLGASLMALWIAVRLRRWDLCSIHVMPSLETNVKYSVVQLFQFDLLARVIPKILFYAVPMVTFVGPLTLQPLEWTGVVGGADAYTSPWYDAAYANSSGGSQLVGVGIGMVWLVLRRYHRHAYMNLPRPPIAELASTLFVGGFLGRICGAVTSFTITGFVGANRRAELRTAAEGRAQESAQIEVEKF